MVQTYHVTSLADRAIESPGLCVYCLREGLTVGVRVGPMNKGMAKELQGCRLVFGNGFVDWDVDTEFKGPFSLLAQAIMFFGTDAMMVTSEGQVLPMVASTSYKGSLVCEMHLLEEWW